MTNGAVTSNVNVKPEDAVLEFPAASVDVIVMLWVFSDGDTARFQAPVPSAEVVPNETSISLNTSTVLFASALPASARACS